MSELTAAAIEKIEELAVNASGSNDITVTYEQGRARIYNSRTGDLTYVAIPSVPPTIMVAGIDDLIQACSDYGSNDEVSIWVGSKDVTLLFDVTRIGSATLPLRINPAINVLQIIRDKTPAQLRRILRVDLFGADIQPSDFVEVISNLKFEATQTNDVKLAKGDETIGKSVRSKVTAESEIPDSVSFRIMVYPDLVDLDTDIHVKCAVITDASQGTVSVIPYPGEIEQALLSAVKRIAQAINDELPGVSVFCGNCK